MNISVVSGEFWKTFIEQVFSACQKSSSSVSEASLQMALSFTMIKMQRCYTRVSDLNLQIYPEHTVQLNTLSIPLNLPVLHAACQSTKWINYA